MPKERIAVLGGGLGALSTVFAFTSAVPDWREKYDITVYQPGWRLGGKCASGRDMRDGYGKRILEHGLHIFAGFYHYSFKLLAEAYAELERPANHPNRTVWDAFTGLDLITLMDEVTGEDGTTRYVPWNINFQELPGLPGEGDPPPVIPPLLKDLVERLGWLLPGTGDHAAHGFFAPVIKFFDTLWDGAETVFLRTVDGALDELLRALGMQVSLLGTLQNRDADTLQRLKMAIYLMQTLFHGIVLDEVLEKGFDHLDEEELTAWIFRHGKAVAEIFPKDYPDAEVCAAALARSPVVRSSYDYVFGWKDADITKPNQGAGTALRGCLRFATGYKGHVFYAMRGGMGDVVIAPLYQALRARGVTFEFFSRVEELIPEGDGIGEIVLSRQAIVPAGEYHPLIDVPIRGWPAEHPLPCWPAEPLWDQLRDGAALRASGIDFEAPWSPAIATEHLRRGTHFHRIVLAIPPGELKRIATRLTAEKPAWKAMLGALDLTRTIGVQLWLTRTNDDMGNPDPGRTLTGNAQPLSCWADMTHLLARETWEGASRPQFIAYFCGQLQGGTAETAEAAALAKASAEQQTRDWLARHAVRLWPDGATEGQEVDPALLVAPGGEVGEARLDAQYIRANVIGTELYVQFPPKSVDKRLRADQSGYDNLFLAGDWTRNGLNAGAAEAAVMSGYICAAALRGQKGPIPGEQDGPPWK